MYRIIAWAFGILVKRFPVLKEISSNAQGGRENKNSMSASRNDSLGHCYICVI
jgi:hypothetical protein